jgi:repressor LexA
MRALTDRQRDVLNFMRAFTGRHGVPPTVREIGQKFQVTPRAAFDHLRALERKGMLQRRASVGRTSRVLTLTEGAVSQAYRSIPILGRVAAGRPLLAEENREGELPLAAVALPGLGEDTFALRVRGDSMIDAHICDRDLVVVRRQDAAEAGDIVVALIEADGGEQEATVKRYRRDGTHIVLEPAHPTMAPIVIDPAEQAVTILGKVIGLVRGL